MVTVTVVERAERKAVLLRQTVELVERLRANESERSALLEQRDGNCRDLRAAGASIKELQEALGDVSRSTVQNILRSDE